MDKIISSVKEKLGPVVKARAIEFGAILAGLWAENKKAKEAGQEYPHALGALFIPARAAYRGNFDAERLTDAQLVALAKSYKSLSLEDKIRLRASASVVRGAKKQASVDLDELEAAIKEDGGNVVKGRKK